MARRSKKNVTGLGWSGNTQTQTPHFIFQCINSECKHFIVTESNNFSPKKVSDSEVIVECPKCGFTYSSEGIKTYLEQQFSMTGDDLEELLSGSNFDFDKSAQEYLLFFFQSQKEWKYCSICETLKPLTSFHKHKRTATGRQHECSACKNRIINTILNPLRTSEQLREGAEGRRLYYMTMGKESLKVDRSKLLDKFNNECFKCGKDLDSKNMHLDHTLPAKLLWPLGFGPTPLCDKCNGDKAESWPSEFYADAELKELSAKTGISYSILSGEPHIYPEAVETVKGEGMDKIVRQSTPKPIFLYRLRKLFKNYEGIDILDYLSEYKKSDIEKLLNS